MLLCCSRYFLAKSLGWDLPSTQALVKTTFHGLAEICTGGQGDNFQLFGFWREMMQTQTRGLVLGKFRKRLPEAEGKKDVCQSACAPPSSHK